MASDRLTVPLRRGGRGYSTGDIHATATIFNRPSPAIDPLTARSLLVWSAGDYDRISAGFRDEAEAFVERLSHGAEHRVLDAACGSGHQTIPAARTGAHVTGFDLVPQLLATAADWAAREELRITLDQGTVEKLPYADGQFDVVMSMFGIMFAARPDRVLGELARVTRPGGRVALANWTRGGFVGRMLAAHVSYVAPPAALPSPLMWGDPTVIRERFDSTMWDVTTVSRTLTFRYPLSPAGTAALFRIAYGPTVRALDALDDDRRAMLTRDLADLWASHQRPGAERTEVEAEYLEVIATRR
jgi:SAM-dependent methyltransferase